MENNKKEYKSPSLAVDCIVMTPKGIVLIERKNPPHGFAIPGGFVDEGEILEDAARREMQEELNLKVEIVGRLGIYDKPDRDPRQHVISIVYVGKSNKSPVAGDDAKEAFEVPIIVKNGEPVFDRKLAFDHEDILRDFVKSKFYVQKKNV